MHRAVSDTPKGLRIVEVCVVLAICIGYVIFHRELEFNLWFIGPMLLLIVGYLVYVALFDQRSLKDFGLRKDNLPEAIKLNAMVFGPIMAGSFIYAAINGTPNLWVVGVVHGVFGAFAYYVYCQNDPINYIDYLGLERMEVDHNAPFLTQMQQLPGVVWRNLLGIPGQVREQSQANIQEYGARMAVADGVMSKDFLVGSAAIFINNGLGVGGGIADVKGNGEAIGTRAGYVYTNALDYGYDNAGWLTAMDTATWWNMQLVLNPGEDALTLETFSGGDKLLRFTNGVVGTSSIALPGGHYGGLGYGFVRTRVSATQILATATRAEAQVTPVLSEIANSTGGKLEGLNFRIKSFDSLVRKLQDTPANKIIDALRYTLVYDDGLIVSSASEAIAALQRLGYRNVNIKNTFLPGQPYKGINTTFQTPAGQFFELQFHTPTSFHFKQTALHSLYEIARVLPPGSPERVALELQMIELSSEIPNPAGIGSVNAF